MKFGNYLISMFKKLWYSGYYDFKDSKSYWKDRYRVGDTSGSGSYGELAIFKAEVLNDFVNENNLNSVIEFGCGDGNQLSLYNFKKYVGVDVSAFVVNKCREIFKKNKNFEFYLDKNLPKRTAELSLSIDVIFHLTEDYVFNDYMNKLFDSSEKYVIIYSSNTNDNSENSSPHVKHRKFTDWIENNRNEFKLINKIHNKFPYNGNDNTSFSEFYFYKK